MNSKTQLVKDEQLTYEKATQLVKDEQLTYEKLTALCRKQEEQIADLRKTIKEEVKAIGKDLEVLKILKKHFCFGLIEKSWAYLLTIVDTEDLEERDGIDCTAMTCLNVQDSKIIKEWLKENE